MRHSRRTHRFITAAPLLPSGCFLQPSHTFFYLVVLGRVAHIEERLGLRALKGDLVDLLEERELGLDTLRLERLHHVLRGARALFSKQASNKRSCEQVVRACVHVYAAAACYCCVLLLRAALSSNTPAASGR